MSRRIGGLLLIAFAIPISNLPAADFEYDLPPLSYSDGHMNDPVARLQERLDRGTARLDHDPRQGYLKSVLEQLSVPVSSQVLVFSKTSFQRDRISPETPRALYFNDDVYIGWVQGGNAVEVSAVDPQKGAVFYTLSQETDDVPKFRRQTHECLQCHDSSLSQGVPGHVVRSVYPDRRGQPILSAGTFVTNDQSPLRERWGGWYVTGTHGAQTHMGNLVVRERATANRPEQIDLAGTGNRTDLAGLCRTAPYLSPHSDIVALMVLEHQTHLHNLLTRANYQTRLALNNQAVMNRALGRPADQRLESTDSRIKSVGEPLVRALLFADEAPLTSRVAGSSSFAREFASRGPHDSRGRTLREFDLERRMFKYPCSFLIYSPAFDEQPAELKAFVYRRLWQVLNDQDDSGKFTHLSAADREAIRDILRETKLDLPEE